MIGALRATPTIGLQQHDGVATLIGEAGGESESTEWGRIIPWIVLVVGVGVCVRITDGINEFPSVCGERTEGFDYERLVVEVEVLLGDDLVVAPVLLVGVDVGGVSSLRCTLGVQLATLGCRSHVGEEQGVGDAEVNEHGHAVRGHVLDDNVGL